MNTPPDDPVLELAKREKVTAPPPVVVLPMGAPTVVFSVVGCGLGAAVAGPVGACVGAGVGWCVDAVRRRWRR
jgi:hypothetical protein